MDSKIWIVGALLVTSAFAAGPRPSAHADKTEGIVPHVEQLGDMSVARAAHQATLLANGEVLVTGGCAAHGCERILASAELYDPASHSFRPAAPMGTPRASHEAILLADGRVLVSGGWTGSRSTARAEVYDPALDRWSPVGAMTEPRASHNAVTLPDDRVLVVGSSAEIFDPATGEFSATGPMQPNGATYLPVGLADGRALVTGGASERGEVLSSAQIFDPATGGFHRTGDMGVPRYKHAGALLPDGRVLILGGSDDRDSRGRYRSTEIYDPSRGEFSPGPPMRWARFKIRDAVVALPSSGAVLVAGGALGAELFDPVDEDFVSVDGEFDAAKMFATATLLAAEEVLVLGGYDDDIQPSASAWLVRGLN